MNWNQYLSKISLLSWQDMDVDLIKNITEDVKNFEINENSFFFFLFFRLGDRSSCPLGTLSAIQALFSRPSTYESPIVPPIVPSLNYDLLMQVIVG
jgi:hypothetical protein